MATFADKRQDMPPQGGYKPIYYKRVPPKQLFSGKFAIAGYFGITGVAVALLGLSYKAVHYNNIERRSAQFALYPMLLAERDREYLKQLRRNRDEERELMSNVEGWKVGTYYGKPIYKTVPKDALLEPNFHEYYAHANIKDIEIRRDLPQWA